MQKCMYCGCEIPDERAITVCDKCGAKVWGEKMFNAIKKNMGDARERGDLCHTPCVGEVQTEINNSENLPKL